MSTTSPYASTSRTAHSTPIRAITSTIASRSAPALPPASQAYEPLVKSLFSHRLKYVLILSALTSWVVQSVWVWWAVDGDVGLGSGIIARMWARVVLAFSPSLLVSSLFTWGLVALPVIVLRKVFLTPRRLGTTSPRSTIKTALAQSSTRVAFLTYFASAAAALTIHVVMAYTYESPARGDPKLSLFVKSRKHPHYLNGRLVFLLVSQFVTSIAFTLRGAMTDRFAYRWSYAISKNSPRSLVLTVSFFISLVNSLLSLLASSLLFTLLRLALPVLYALPILPHLLRPFTAHFLRGQWTLMLLFSWSSVGVLVRAWAVAASTFLVWELGDVFFEHVVSEPTPVSAFSPDPNTTLISGSTSPSRIYKFFAYSELLELASSTTPSSSTRRSSLFGDQKTSSLNLWGTLCRESLILLGEDYQLLLRRGKPVPVAAPLEAPTKAKVLPNPNPEIAKPAVLLRQRVWKGDAGGGASGSQSPGEAALDALAADGPLARVADAALGEVDRVSHHVPELFRSVTSRSPVKAEKAKEKVQEAQVSKANRDDNNLLGLGDVTSALKSFFNLQAHLSSLKLAAYNSLTSKAHKLWGQYGRKEVTDRVVWFLKWWSEERVSRVVEAAVPFREVDVLVIDVLSHLVCASLTEDAYGTVQRDIPKILEAFTSFLIAVEEYQAEMTALLKPIPPNTVLSIREQYERNALEVEVWRAGEVLGFVGDGLKEGIGRIIRTFGDKLLAFKFPPRVAGKLQGFADYAVPVQ